MKKFFIVLFVAAVALAAYPFLIPSDKKESLTGLPWQIELTPDGSTRVFGLQLDISRLSDAQRLLGDDMEVAIIVSNDESTHEAGSLEMYYGHYRAGLLSGKLVLQTKVAVADMKRWRDNAVKFEYMASGMAKKYILDKVDLPQALNSVIVGISFVPVVNLDEKVISDRFGEPGERIVGEGVTHFLYPEKGLDIALHEESKEVLQYVSPEKFQQLVNPLR